MNREEFKGQWNMMKGKLKEKWGKLTDDDITQINGKRDELLGRMQKRYGMAKERAEQELMQWENTHCGPCGHEHGTNDEHSHHEYVPSEKQHPKHEKNPKNERNDQFRNDNRNKNF